MGGLESLLSGGTPGYHPFSMYSAEDDTIRQWRTLCCISTDVIGAKGDGADSIIAEGVGTDGIRYEGVSADDVGADSVGVYGIGGVVGIGAN